ncbi:MAG: hypothetical protein PHI37_04220 [Candidatus Gracilibacteria bacterium]|nr:hypothetical protein [Candidatus Gracilibacteria bacterium]
MNRITLHRGGLRGSNKMRIRGFNNKGNERKLNGSNCFRGAALKIK